MFYFSSMVSVYRIIVLISAISEYFTADQDLLTDGSEGSEGKSEQ